MLAGTNRYRIRVGDIIVVAVVVLASVASMILIARARAGGKGGFAVIEVNGKEESRIDLENDQPRQEFIFRGLVGRSTVEVEKGRVRMLSSDCRDRICVGSGWVDSPGESIVCLPNRVVIRISGERSSGGVDTVTE